METTVLARKNIVSLLQTESLKIEKIANCKNMHNVPFWEATEICTSKAEVCKDMTHLTIACRWKKVIEKGNRETDKWKTRESIDFNDWRKCYNRQRERDKWKTSESADLEHDGYITKGIRTEDASVGVKTFFTCILCYVWTCRYVCNITYINIYI